MTKPTNKMRVARRWAAMGVVFLVALGTLYIFRDSVFRVGKSPVEVSASLESLELKDGRLFPPGSDQAFSGILLDAFPDGSTRARSEVRDGQLHGLSEGWFPAGTLEIREYFEQGKSHGKRQRFNTEGNLISEVEIRNGELHGTFRRFHPNGKVAEIIEMNEGKPTGVSKAFYPNGAPRAEVTFKDHEMVKQIFWNEYGVIVNSPP